MKWPRLAHAGAVCALAAGGAAAVVAARYAAVVDALWLTDWRVPGCPRRLALTFDDGPDPATTPGVLEDLDQAGVRATFFVVGERAAAHPGLLKETASAGHEIALHGWTHRHAVFQRSGTLRRSLGRGADAVDGATGARPALYRPPYGVLAPAAARAARSEGMRPYLWSHWARDWKVRPAADIEADLWSAVTPGAVVLLHDGEGTGGQDGAVAAMRPALRGFLGRLREEGWEAAPLGALLELADR